MKKRISAVIIMLLVSVIILSACGKGSEKTNDISSSSTAALENSTEKSSASVENNDSAKKSNLEALLDLMKKVAEERSFADTRNYGKFIGTFATTYKDNIVNPYNKGTSIPAIDKLISEIENKDEKFSNSSASVVVIASSYEFLKNVDKKDIVYGTNENSKGMVMAFVFNDGFYLYEIDEKGNKTNETTYMFPNYEYPSYANKK